MIGAWVDARFDDVLNCVGRLARWVLERRKSFVPIDLSAGVSSDWLFEDEEDDDVQAASAPQVQPPLDATTAGQPPTEVEPAKECHAAFAFLCPRDDCERHAPRYASWRDVSHIVGGTGPAGSAVRDTKASAADGVAGEDAPQNQPPVRFTPLPVDEPCDNCGHGWLMHKSELFIKGAEPCIGCEDGCRRFMGAQPVGEHLDPKLLRSENPIYQQLINENRK